MRNVSGKIRYRVGLKSHFERSVKRMFQVVSLALIREQVC
jgi:hypothetical protein